jgi:hypothetical protein
MLQEQQTPIPPEPRRIHAHDTRLLRVGADSSGQCQGPTQSTFYQPLTLDRKSIKGRNKYS